MSTKAKVLGSWVDATPYIKISGSWKIPKAILSKQNGKWQSSFLQGGIPDQSLTDTIQSSFMNIGSGFDATPSALAVQSDGKILVAGAGAFNSFKGMGALYSQRLHRLNKDGSLDSDFSINIGSGFDVSPNTIAIQSDGKILVGGNFTTLNGTSVSKLVRLNSDGTLDGSFTSNTLNFSVSSIFLYSDNSILIGGAFTTINGTSVGRIAKLSANGVFDSTFNSSLGAGANNTVLVIKVQSDGKILVGGEFTTMAGFSINAIARLNSSGTLDTAFRTAMGTGPTSSPIVRDILIQSDGKIIIVGQMTAWAFTAGLGHIARLLSTGARDTTFSTTIGTAANADLNKILQDSSGNILLLGNGLTSFNGTTVRGAVRLSPALSLDSSFNSNMISRLSSGFVISGSILQDNTVVLVAGGASGRLIKVDSSGNSLMSTNDLINNGVVNSMVKQADGKILLGGTFVSSTKVPYNYLIRLNADWSLDTSFNTNLGTGPNGEVKSIAAQPNGGVVVVGAFTSINSTAVNRIARLNSDGTLDTTFISNIGTGANNTVNAVISRPDSRIVLAGTLTQFNGVFRDYILGLNSNGTLDSTFSPGAAAVSVVDNIALLSDNKILVVGNLTGGIIRLNTNGTRDTVFQTARGTGANARVYSLGVLPNGKIVIGGNFSSYNGVTTNRGVAKLNSDGTLDTSFTSALGTGPNTSAIIYTILVQNDSKIIFSGAVTSVNGTLVKNIFRTSEDGTLDTAFNSNIGLGPNVGYIRSMVLDSNDKILLTGEMSAFKSTVASRIVRIGSNLAY